MRALSVEWGSYTILVGTGTVLTVKMDLVSCAQRICDTIACAFMQQAGINVNCEVITIDNDTVKLLLAASRAQGTSRTVIQVLSSLST